MPFTLTVTVSTLPAPFGPSIKLVLSVLKSLAGAFVCNIDAGGLPTVFLNQGISVNSAPPMKFSSEVGPGLGLDVPLSMRPFVVVPAIRSGRGKMEAGLATETMRSRARRYEGRVR